MFFCLEFGGKIQTLGLLVYRHCNSEVFVIQNIVGTNLHLFRWYFQSDPFLRDIELKDLVSSTLRRLEVI